MKILIVDDQRSARHVLRTMAMTLDGVHVVEVENLAQAKDVLASQAIDVALIDIRLTADARNRDGLNLLEELRGSGVVPIVVTALSDMTSIRAAMRAGAHDFLPKDELCDELVLPILRALQNRCQLHEEVVALRARRVSDDVPIGLVGTSHAMDVLRAGIRRVAVSDRPVLVLGPTGSGKELVVRALHALGPHPEEPLLDLNCSAIPEALLESQLFGYEPGAISGAESRYRGYLSAVGKGTLFLDEIAELPLALQAKLLLVTETRRFRPVGSSVEHTFEGRIISVTHADLKSRAEAGQFRQDLFYRLDVLVLRVPSLDQRREDIPALISHFVGQQRRALRFTAEAMDSLMTAAWPGNVRQLRNLVDRLTVFAEDDIVSRKAVELVLTSDSGRHESEVSDLRSLVRTLLQLPVPNRLETVEQALIEEAMVLSEGSKSAAARLLGVHRKSVERRIGKWRLEGHAEKDAESMNRA